MSPTESIYSNMSQLSYESAEYPARFQHPVNPPLKHLCAHVSRKRH